MTKNDPATQDKTNVIADYVKGLVSFKAPIVDGNARSIFFERIEKSFALLPEEVLDLFLKGSRNLVVVVMADTELPLGMGAKSEGPAKRRKYMVLTYSEHSTWPENRFIGAFLRELAHVATERPPENEWPLQRGDRARFKEQLEHHADAMVWRWGLRHYSMSYLDATYPPHWVERIVVEIGRILLEENPET
jgi:hypothetical protein